MYICHFILQESAICFICFHRLSVGLHIYIYVLRNNKLDYYDKLSSNPCCSSHLPGKPGGGKVINLHHLLPPLLNLTVPGLLGSHKAWVFYIGYTRKTMDTRETNKVIFWKNSENEFIAMFTSLNP